MQLYQILYRFTILFLLPARFVNISVPHLLFTENLPEKSESFIAETGKMCYDGSAQYKRTIKIYALGGDNNMSSESKEPKDGKNPLDNMPKGNIWTALVITLALVLLIS